MTTRQPKPTFHLLLQPVPRADGSDPEGTHRLRRALKSQLRAWGLRCVLVEPVAEELPLPTGPLNHGYADALQRPPAGASHSCVTAADLAADPHENAAASSIHARVNSDE